MSEIFNFIINSPLEAFLSFLTIVGTYVGVNNIVRIVLSLIFRGDKKVKASVDSVGDKVNEAFSQTAQFLGDFLKSFKEQAEATLEQVKLQGQNFKATLPAEFLAWVDVLIAERPDLKAKYIKLVEEYKLKFKEAEEDIQRKISEATKALESAQTQAEEVVSEVKKSTKKLVFSKKRK